MADATGNLIGLHIQLQMIGMIGIKKSNPQTVQTAIHQIPVT